MSDVDHDAMMPQEKYYDEIKKGLVQFSSTELSYPVAPQIDKQIKIADTATCAQTTSPLRLQVHPRNNNNNNNKAETLDHVG